MKQVVNNEKKTTVELRAVNNEKQDAFKLKKSSANCGYIAADDMLDNRQTFRARFFIDMTEGNPWTNNFNTLQECVDCMINGHGAEVFEFNTYQEMFKWASQL